MYSIKYGDKLKTKEELFGAVFFPSNSNRNGTKVETPIPKGTVFTVNDFGVNVLDSVTNEYLDWFAITSFNEIGGSNHQYYFTTNYYKEYHKHFHSLFEPVKGVLK